MAGRRTAAAAMAAFAVLVGGACGASSPDRRSTPASTTTSEPATSEPTAAPHPRAPQEVLPGVAIVRGSRLLGTTFPGPTSDRTGDTAPDEPSFRTSTVVIAVDAAPGAVFDAYANALAEAGYGAEATRSGESTCSFADGEGADALADGAVPTNRGDELLPVTCTLSIGTVRMQLSITGPGEDALWSSTLRLRLTAADDAKPGAPGRVDPALLIGDRADRLPGPGTAPSIPAAGERMAPSKSWTHDPADPSNDFLPVHELTVPPGLELVIPAAVVSGIGSWVTVGHTDHDPTKVLDAMVAQMGVTSAGVEQDETVRGRRVVGRSWDEAGGDKLYLTAVELDDGWYVLVETSTDP